MSTFSGTVEEYPLISIDNFTPLVSTYFISHLHLDHITGVEDLLLLPGLKIYTSHTTVKLIVGRYSDLKKIHPFIHGLNIGETNSIKVDKLSINGSNKRSEGETIKVTLIPSGHCLGSVMFLIDGSNGEILYTGDFRMSIGSSNKMKMDYKIGHLKTIYLDTTFFNRKSIYFPSREESILRMLDIIESFLQKDSDNIVQIFISTRYTLEVLYHLIFMRLNIKVHVHWDYYAQLSELDDCFLSCIDHLNFNSRIHACYMTESNSMSDICSKKFEVAKSKNKFLKIIPSALWWVERGMRNKEFIFYVDSHTVRVCFSSHSSYSEILDLLLTLSADSIHDCVQQPDFEFIKEFFNGKVITTMR